MISDWIIKKLKIRESVDESVYGYLNDIYNGKDVKLSELKDNLYYNTNSIQLGMVDEC